MPLSPTNRYMNVSTLTFQPSGASVATAVKGVKNVALNEGFEILQESADADLYPTVGGVTLINPTVTVSTIDAYALMSVAGGTYGTLIYTSNDFTNAAQTGGGAKTATLTNAFLGGRSRDQAYRQLGTESLTFHCTSTDGATNPLAITSV